MVVLSIEKYEPAVRGMLTRFMTELRASVFVGDIPANTREYIWKYVESQPNIDAIMIYNANNEQGFFFIQQEIHLDPSGILTECNY